MVRTTEIGTTVWFGVGVALALWAGWMTRRGRRLQGLLAEEQRLRRELDAYAGLDPRLAAGESPRELAKRVCLTIVRQSAFGRAAMLVRDAEQRLHVVGSAGVDDLLLAALDGWGERVPRVDERRTRFPVTLGPRDLSGRDCRQVMILPMWSRGGAMLGALAVCPVGDERLLKPMEALAAKLARALDAVAMRERLARAEKMAGLGQLAKGVAHELNNPLTAVLGFAELISVTSSDGRVRADALAIVGQAMRMRETVESLLRFWRPATQWDAVVDLAEVLRGLVAKRRDVRLVLQVEGDGFEVRGLRERLVEVFEHLLDNAAQAVAAGGAVRVAMTCDGEKVRVVVSDSGVGFEDAARVFDPFYTTRQPGEGQGLGLAVSYGIVREHGGEISAMNLEPKGAAVVVELPVARVEVEAVVGVARG